jgi:arsenate reductase (thioredoxin)
MNSRREKKKVLFVCRHNSCRSQMAEALLRHRAGDRYEAFSAGLESRPIHPLAPVVMDELGIDLSGQRSKTVGEYLGKLTVHYAIVVCHLEEESCPKLYPFALHFDQWPFEDPAACRGSEDEVIATFRAVRDQIADRIDAWLAGLKSESNEGEFLI